MMLLIGIPVVGILLVLLVQSSRDTPVASASPAESEKTEIVPRQWGPGEQAAAQSVPGAAVSNRPYERVKLPTASAPQPQEEEEKQPDFIPSAATAARVSIDGSLRLFDRALKQENFAHAKRLLAELERDGCDAARLEKAKKAYEEAMKPLPDKLRPDQRPVIGSQRGGSQPGSSQPGGSQPGGQPPAASRQPTAPSAPPPVAGPQFLGNPSIPESDPRRSAPVPGRLVQDFNSKDFETRVNAARQLAATGSDAAAYPLAKGLDDADTGIAGVCREGLVSLGGARAGEHLVQLYRDASQERQRAALGVLRDIAQKSLSDALTISPFLGRFALSNDEDVSREAISTLTALGKAGGPGLLVAIESTQPEKQVAVMNALAAVRYYKAAHRMGDFLIQGDGFTLEKLRNTAMGNLIAMGPHTIPYLIPHLQTRCRQWTAVTLRRMTGVKLGYNDAKEWRDWYETNKSTFGDGTDPAVTPSGR